MSTPSSRSGRSGATVAASISGLGEFQAQLKALGPAWPRQLSKVNRAIAKEGAAYARAEAEAMGGIQAKAASAITGSGTQARAAIVVADSEAVPFAKVAFWGADRHSGWFAKPQYESSTSKQHPAWVGSSWDVAVAGEGPYAINTALARHLPDLLDHYAAGLNELVHTAFPD